MNLSSLIKLTDITKSYTKGEITTQVLHGINLNIEQRDLLAIVGTSGSGKSSLMNIIGLLDKPTTGEYLLNDINIMELSSSKLSHIRNKEIGFIFQSFFLLPRLTILENVALPLTYRELNKDLITKASLKSLERVSLAHLAHRFPRELSGGQQQRVAIARALVGEPGVILADEPTGALDSKMSQDIMNLFIQLNQMDKNTIVIITHDPKIAEQCLRRVKIQDGLLVQ